jgi:colicin import membrane protein
MSTVSKPPARRSRPTPAEPDPYRYGWRYVRMIQPDGEEDFDQVPLSLEDVLHPEEGDFIVHTNAHNKDCAYLKSVCDTRLKDVRRALVLSDCRIDWNLPGVRPLGPDLAVFLNVRRKRVWATFYLAKEGARPMMVIEVTSPDTRKNDVGPKVKFYEQAGVPLYIIADVKLEKDNERRIQFITYRLTATGYQCTRSDQQSRVWLDPVQLWLGVTRDRLGGFNRLACFDPETGEEVGDYTAISEALVESQALVAAATQARSEAERGRDAAERGRDEAERGRDEAEERARAEANARAEAEERIRQLEAQLKRPRKRKP